MRVLHFLPVYAPAWQFGGPILSVSRLCESLVQRGVDVRVITTNAGLPEFPIDELGVTQSVNGVDVVYYPVDSQAGSIRSSALVEDLHNQLSWADLLHLSSIWQPLGLSVQQAAHSLGVPVIQTLRGALGPYSWRRGLWKKLPYFFFYERPLLQRAAAIHGTTAKELDEISWLALRPSKYILPNPLDLSQFRFDPILGKRWRVEMNIPLEDPLFLVVGRMHHKKGLDLLPKVFHSLRNQSWQIIFIGNDEDGTRSQLQREFLRFGLDERCYWLEAMPTDQLIAPYNAANFLLLPSHHENFGNVVIEALACGCGVIISEQVGASEMLAQCPGVIVSKRSSTSWLAATAESFSSDKPGIMSERWVKSHFSSHQIAEEAVKIYTSVLSND